LPESQLAGAAQVPPQQWPPSQNPASHSSAAPQAEPLASFLTHEPAAQYARLLQSVGLLQLALQVFALQA
jgi:hypothetical protein